MMLSVRDETGITNSRISFPPNFWFYLTVEFLIGVAISGFLTTLGIIKSFLPKPPRDLTGNVVLIAGASSTLGESLAEEFARGGCSVVCVDNDLRSIREITTKLRSPCCKVEGIGPDHRKHEQENVRPTMAAYECDLLDRNAIREIAKKVEDEVGGVDVLVTCVGQSNQDIFDMASTTLMSYYWIMLAFLPFMLRREKPYIVGVTPVSSTQDVYLGSRAAITGLMESLGQELSNRSGHLTFLTISPTTQHREYNSVRQKEQEMAKEVVQAISRDETSISWCLKILYRINYMIYSAITKIKQWLHTQRCDYSF